MTYDNDFRSPPRPGFTLMETVIAIGVLAVLLTAFLAVFAPAAQGVRKAISIQEADRLAHTVEKGLVTVRENETYETGFAKAFEFITDSASDDKSLVVYQYRGDPSRLRSDGTNEPFTGQGSAGDDFLVRPILRQKSDQLLQDDLRALEGRVYLVKTTQLVSDGSGNLVLGSPGKISDPEGGGGSTAESFPEAVIAFQAEFYRIPTSSYEYIRSLDPDELKNPMFTRNLAVRR